MTSITTVPFRSRAPPAGSFAVPESEARKTPGPGAYDGELVRNSMQRAATHSMFVSALPRMQVSKYDMDIPGPQQYAPSDDWGRSGRSYSMGPRANRYMRTVGLARHVMYVDINAQPSQMGQLRWVRHRGHPTISTSTPGSVALDGSGFSSGVGAATTSVGPASYTPNHKAVAPRTVTADFGRSTGRATEPGGRTFSARRQVPELSAVAIGPPGAEQPGAHIVSQRRPYTGPSFKRKPVRRETSSFSQPTRAGTSNSGAHSPGIAGFPTFYDVRERYSQPVPPFRPTPTLPATATM